MRMRTGFLGNYDSYTEGNRTVYAPKWKILEWYAQDNWKITPRLTLDYGLRFSYDFPYTLDPGAGVIFVPSRYDPSKSRHFIGQLHSQV